jgi:hypothetical protein
MIPADNYRAQAAKLHAQARREKSLDVRKQLDSPIWRPPAAQDAAIRKISSILWRLLVCFARIPRSGVLFDRLH